MTLHQVMQRAVAQLQAVGIDGAHDDVRRITAFVLDISSARLSASRQDPFPEGHLAQFDAAIAKRCARHPVSHITGLREFYGRSFSVTADVLDPRPDTETLVAAVLARPFHKVLDLGTGSGCILISLLAERAGCRGIGTDISPAALQVAAHNAERLGVGDRASFLQSDWLGALTPQTFDVIVSNPPYISATEMRELAAEVLHEPHSALTDYGDGLGPYRIIVAQAPAFLDSGGALVFEIGHSQAADVSALCTSAGFASTQIVQDINGRDRCVIAADYVVKNP